MKKIIMKIIGVISAIILIILGLKWRNDATDTEREKVEKYKNQIAQKKQHIKNYKKKIQNIKNKYSKIIK